jgi:hypothetical protein
VTSQLEEAKILQLWVHFAGFTESTISSLSRNKKVKFFLSKLRTKMLKLVTSNFCKNYREMLENFQNINPTNNVTTFFLQKLELIRT